MTKQDIYIFFGVNNINKTYVVECTLIRLYIKYKSTVLKFNYIYIFANIYIYNRILMERESY